MAIDLSWLEQYAASLRGATPTAANLGAAPPLEAPATSRLASALPTEALSAEGQAARAAAAVRTAGAGALPPTAAGSTSGLLQRTIPTFAPALRAAGRAVGYGARALPVVGGIAAAAPAAISIADVAADPGRTKIDVATEAAKQTARLAGATGAGLFAAQAAAPLAPFTLGLAPLLAGGAAGAAAYYSPEILDRIKGLFSGNPAPVATPAATPSAAAGASNDLASELSVGAPAVPANPLTGLPETTSPQDLQEDIRNRSKAASSLLREADKMVGRSGGTVAGANERIRNFGANPAAVETFNAAQGLNRTGIKLSYDERGQPLLSGDPSAQPDFYVGADGKPTTKYEETQQYQQGVELAAKERAQLADIESGNMLKEALADIGRKKTVPGKKLAIELFGHLASAQTARDTSARLGAIEGRKAGIEGGKLQLEAIRTMADAGDKNAQTLVRQLTLRAIAKGDKETALLLQGKEAQGDKFVFDPTQIVTDPNAPRTILNTRVGQPLQVTPRRVATPADLADDMAKKKLTREEVIRLYESRNIDTSRLK